MTTPKSVRPATDGAQPDAMTLVAEGIVALTTVPEVAEEPVAGIPAAIASASTVAHASAASARGRMWIPPGIRWTIGSAGEHL
jgi:hypothetical protein